MDPDPDSEPLTWLNPDPIRIQIRNPAWHYEMADLAWSRRWAWACPDGTQWWTRTYSCIPPAQAIPVDKTSIGETQEKQSQQTGLGSIPASSDTVESEGRQKKQCWIQYIEEEKKIQKIPLFKYPLETQEKPI